MTRRKSSAPLDKLLAALAEPTRRTIFERILNEPGLTTSQLATRTNGISRWGVMKHLDVLRDAGLVQTMATGRLRRHYPERSSLEPLESWLGER